MAPVGVVSFGTGGFTLWKGVTFESNEDVDEGTGRRTRRRWILAGVGLLVFGLSPFAGGAIRRTVNTYPSLS